MSFIKGIISRIFSRDFYNRQFKKIKSSFIRLDATPNPTLIMTLLVKNEEDIIEENLIFHKAMGVDGFIVTDNNSTDNTVLILKKYLDKGWIKEIIHETDDNYMQAAWVDKMILIAKNKYNVDWIINADADEFWYCKSGNIKNEISRTKANILKCNMRCVLPEENKEFYKWVNTVKPIENPELYKLSRFSIYNPQFPKVMHRTSYYQKIHVGNHSVDMKYIKEEENQNILIYHYSIRDMMHFTNKVIIGGKALEKNPNKTMGVHCRYWYELYKQNKLTQEYNRIIGKHLFDLFKEIGTIQQDTTIYNILSKLLQQ